MHVKHKQHIYFSAYNTALLVQKFIAHNTETIFLQILLPKKICHIKAFNISTQLIFQ
jgi:hypothetical protein